MAVSDLGMREARCRTGALGQEGGIDSEPGGRVVAAAEGPGGGPGQGAVGPGGRTTEGFRGWESLITSGAEVCMTHFPHVGPCS